MPMKLSVILITALLVAACATSPTGRKQLRFMSDSQMKQMGAAAFDETKKKEKVSTDQRMTAFVSCVSNHITRQVGGQWEVQLFDDDAVNAFALPGGKIGVYKGLFKAARNQDQLASVIGHEVGHVLAKHANERVSTAFATEGAIQLAGAISGGGATGQRVMAMMGMGAQVGILLPWGRTQESESDLIGLDLMARAGFDPRQSVAVWQNMAQIGGNQPPEFLSTHPSHQTRIENLNNAMPQALQTYKQAQASGKRPSC